MWVDGFSGAIFACIFIYFCSSLYLLRSHVISFAMASRQQMIEDMKRINTLNLDIPQSMAVYHDGELDTKKVSEKPSPKYIDVLKWSFSKDLDRINKTLVAQDRQVQPSRRSLHRLRSRQQSQLATSSEVAPAEQLCSLERAFEDPKQ